MKISLVGSLIAMSPVTTHQMPMNSGVTSSFSLSSVVSLLFIFSSILKASPETKAEMVKHRFCRVDTIKA